MKTLKNVLLTAVPTAVCAIAGSVITALNLDYPQTLKLPSYYPPGWLFAVVWTAVFILIVIASTAALTNAKSRAEKENALFVFNIQLVFNLLWSVCFFSLKMPWLAFGEIVLLLAVIAVMTVEYGKIKRLCAYLLIPYIVWVAFAAFFLNLPIAIMN
ncbi:MAG: tryptophan-rich sensory protein [Clostridia bacterium]|nr:tryptophan-rich sensory protein [Clostridia bacterium]